MGMAVIIGSNSASLKATDFAEIPCDACKEFGLTITGYFILFFIIS